MKKTTLVLAVLFFTNLQIQAQFVDGMEYPNGIPPSSTWWDCTDSCLEIVNFFAHSGGYSGSLGAGPGPQDAQLLLGDKTSGEWGLAFYMYIPGTKTGYWALVEDDNYSYVTAMVFFNEDNLSPGGGQIYWTPLGYVEFDYPTDEWFRVVVNIDMINGISMATWQLGIDGVEVIPAGTPFTNSTGDIPIHIGTLDFFSIDANNEYYLDDFEYVNGVLDLLLGVDENETLKFSVSPNPVTEKLNITTQTNIVSSRIYSLQGGLVFESATDLSIDVSQLTSGVYFIELTTDAGKSVQKFIKN